jgi:hypothetical protein
MAQPFLSRRNCATFFWLDSGFEFTVERLRFLSVLQSPLL